MEIRKIRAEMQMGRSVFNLPLRVTFYARVSTDKAEQKNSLENQIQYYTRLIQSKSNWTYVEGYVDEGISGTSTKRRESFNRMIADAKEGRFDFIITKEISRFSRSTLDSIKYTQELLEHNVGVLFQNDNINTLDADSEFRLVVMAGVAQDEVRKLSERLKFGFRQSIQNGRVLGNDQLWGYDKKNCKLTVNEEEAAVVQLVFDLYANHHLGIRRVSQRLFDMGYKSRRGNAFNVQTIRNMLTNPKYKGWYCGNKTQSLDYRSKKKAFLGEEEWVMYRDPEIPALVSEELWDRANALYKAHREQMMAHRSAAAFHNRYAYSGKIICEEHKASFHRQLLANAGGGREVWQCKIYRQRGREGCKAPQLQTEELNEVMAQIFSKAVQDKSAVVEELLSMIRSTPEECGYERERGKLEEDARRIQAKKDCLLEMSAEKAIGLSEFRNRNDSFNLQLGEIERKLKYLQKEQEMDKISRAEGLDRIRDAAMRELNFADGINEKLAASILDHIVVKRDSYKEKIHLEVYVKSGQIWDVCFAREKSSLCCIRFL
ncbi:MAG: recombinase family protein [Oscillospiraceae bacterium]|nr:recombinase family protein [Oscillospiraceae bacterium]